MGRRLPIPEPLRGLAKLAKQQNWTIERTRGNHLQWRSPAGEVVTSGSTPGDWRDSKNVRRDLIKAGLIIE